MNGSCSPLTSALASHDVRNTIAQSVSPIIACLIGCELTTLRPTHMYEVASAGDLPGAVWAVIATTLV